MFNNWYNLIFQEGVNPKELDQMTKKMGFPVGSATLVDEVGVDVGMHVGNFMAETFGDRYGFTPGDVSMLSVMVEKGFLGMLFICNPPALHFIQSILYVPSIICDSMQ